MDVNQLPENEREVAIQAIHALENHLCLSFKYHGLPRVVEVHAVGISTTGKAVMRVFQVDGEVLKSESPGWKMMTLGKIFQPPKLESLNSLAPRPDYHKGDAGMTQIFKEI